MGKQNEVKSKDDKRINKSLFDVIVKRFSLCLCKKMKPFRFVELQPALSCACGRQMPQTCAEASLHLLQNSYYQFIFLFNWVHNTLFILINKTDKMSGGCAFFTFFVVKFMNSHRNTPKKQQKCQ
jgi:hypothetical protein